MFAIVAYLTDMLLARNLTLSLIMLLRVLLSSHLNNSFSEWLCLPSFIDLTLLTCFMSCTTPHSVSIDLKLSKHLSKFFLSGRLKSPPPRLLRITWWVASRKPMKSDLFSQGGQVRRHWLPATHLHNVFSLRAASGRRRSRTTSKTNEWWSIWGTWLRNSARWNRPWRKLLDRLYRV